MWRQWWIPFTLLEKTICTGVSWSGTLVTELLTFFLVSDLVRRSLGRALDSHVVFSFHFRWFDGMETKKIVVWQQDGVWLGYLQEFPDYWTQGDSPEELREHLIDLYADLSGGLIDGARRVEDLVVS
jgi:hypothetical protein